MSSLKNSEDSIDDGFRSSHSYVGHSLVYIKGVVKYYTIIGASNLMFLCAKPILAREGVLPFPSIPTFDYDEHRAGFYALYANQFLNAIFTGGINIAVNILMYTMLICIHFVINLLGCRLRRFGHDSIRGSTQKHTANYRRIIELIHCHIKIEQSVPTFDKSHFPLHSYPNILFQNRSGYAEDLQRLTLRSGHSVGAGLRQLSICLVASE